MGFFGWLGVLWDVASLRVIEDPSLGLPTLGVSALIALAAGCSTLLGHSAILFINRVHGIRFVASLLVGTVFLVLLHAGQALMLWLAAPLITGTRASASQVLALTLASTAPQVYGFLTFIPHLGLLIGRILQGWSALCLWLLVMALFDTTWWQALLATGAAWLLMQLASRLLGPAVGAITSKAWTLVTGRPAQLDARDVLAGAPFVPVESKANL